MGPVPWRSSGVARKRIGLMQWGGDRPDATNPHVTTRHATARHFPTLHVTTRHDTARHRTALHLTPLHNSTHPLQKTLWIAANQLKTDLHGTSLHNTSRHCTTRHSTTLHLTTRHNSTHPPLTHSSHGNPARDQRTGRRFQHWEAVGTH